MFLFLRFIMYNELTRYMKIRTSIYTLIMVCLILSSCLSTNDTADSYNDKLALLTFSIKDIKTTIGEGDNEKKFTVKGNDYRFAITQLGPGLVTNERDSLPYQTDLSKVAISMTASGYITYKKGDTDVGWKSSDSIDFKLPVKFTIHNSDGIHKKDYTVKVLAHQVNPDSLIWTKESNTSFPANSFQEIKAVTFNQKVYVFGNTNTQVKVTSSTDGKNWSSVSELEGLAEKANWNSITAFKGKLYLTSNEAIYSSTDAIHWNIEENTVPCQTLIAANRTELIGLNGSHLIYGKLTGNTIQWTQSDKTLSVEFSPSDPSTSITRFTYANYILPSNDELEQTIILGNKSQIWSKLNNEEDWMDYTASATSACPILENISFIKYNEKLYAFGGTGTHNDENIDAFSTFFESNDKGHTWTKKTEDMTLHADLKNINGFYTCVLDDHNYIWIIQSNSTNIFKGKINRLSFEQQD